ncbi:MAG: aminodeoxychorismate/anthranilate synthase component II [Melioribacteraceae bacterium]|nr:aminodeoxychorismate/anthranilate synthase component II [Melioribacteraceae bacterium]
MKILVIDNYDSFTYNLVQLIGYFVDDIIVKRNDKSSIEEIELINPDKIVISPGPGKPIDSGISPNVIKYFGNTIPILGVCLGHQAIAEVFGGKIINAPNLMHGKSSEIIHDGKTIYKNIPQKFLAGRYHSLVVEKKSLPNDFEISSQTSDEIIMGIRHKNFPIEGIQFHPESIMTLEGKNIIKNWLDL